MKRNANQLNYYYHVLKIDNEYKVKRSLFTSMENSVAYFSTKKQAEESIQRRLSEHPQTTEKGEDVQVDSEYENAIRNACLVALEFGYVQCEKGNNLQMAFMNYNKIISNK